jgi:hypothetical protein
MVRYQRRKSSALNWLMFFAIGGVVFGGLVLTLMHFKKKADEQDKAREATQAAAGKPDYVEMVKKVLKGRGQRFLARSDPKKVSAKKFDPPHEVIILHVKHCSEDAGNPPSSEEIVDTIFVIDGTKAEPVKLDRWDEAKERYGIAENPD